jgi:hypothetical protein
MAARRELQLEEQRSPEQYLAGALLAVYALRWAGDAAGEQGAELFAAYAGYA